MFVVRKAAVSVRNLGNAADVIRAWRDYYYAGAIAQFLSIAPRQTTLDIRIDDDHMPFRPSGFICGTVVLLNCIARDEYRVVFFDQSLRDGKGGFLPATVELDQPQRILLGSSRRKREQFVSELVEAAQALAPKQDAPTKASA